MEMPKKEDNYFNKIATKKVAEAVEKGDIKEAWLEELADLNVCSQKGLVETFRRFHRSRKCLHAFWW